MRFTQPDPLAEKYPDTSPYAFCLNNPLSYIDPTGEKTYLFATALPGYDKSIIATHTFIYVDNNNGKFKEQNYFAFGSKLSGVEGMVSGQLVRNYYEDDETAIKNYLSGKQNDRIIKVLEVSGSDNESQDEFDNKVLEVANSFGNNPEITYFFSPRNETEGNCNTSSSTILIKSGLSREKMSSIKDMLPITTVGFSSRPRPWTKDEQRNAVSNKKKIEQFRLTFD